MSEPGVDEMIEVENPTYDSDHEIGENNIQPLGLDFHNPVFLTSAIATVVIVMLSMVFADTAAVVFGSMRSWVTERFDWFFMISANIFVLFAAFLSVSRLGRIRLGGENASPRYGYPGWLAMLFAAGVGIGLMFFGPLEPLLHARNPPLGVDPADIDTARSVGMATTIMHWGFHAWAIYGLVGLSLAFFCFNGGLPLTLRSAFFPLFGNRVWGAFGHFVDIVAVLATLFGLAVSLGFGAEQIAGGLDYLFGIPTSLTSKLFVIVGIIAVALVSVVAGLDKGVKRLSEANMGMAALLWLFVLIVGPTVVILSTMASTVVDYLRYLPALSNWLGRENTDVYHGWTVFYLAWWVSWSPFVGMFIARISYGRTVREFVAWVLVVPTVIGIIWMSTFSGTSMDQFYTEGYQGVAQAVPELALFRMLELLPLSAIVSSISVVLIAIFFITSADSGALVMDIITAGGKMDAPVLQRVFWCVLAGAVAAALMIGGGMQSLQAMTITLGLPFGFVLLIMCIGLYKGLRTEQASIDSEENATSDGT